MSTPTSHINQLLEAADPVWQQYYTHPFVVGMQEGTLDPEKFAYYIQQDYAYLMEYAKVFAIGIAKARDVETMQFFADVISIIIQQELNVHTTSLRKLGIALPKVETIDVHLANRSYTSYMQQQAYMGGALETLAAVLPCALSYEAIARHMVEQNPQVLDHPLYGIWVRGYIDPSYTEGNQRYIDCFERLLGQYGSADGVVSGQSETDGSLNKGQRRLMERCIDIFVTGCRFELGFWDMAWDPHLA